MKHGLVQPCSLHCGSPFCIDCAVVSPGCGEVSLTLVTLLFMISICTCDMTDILHVTRILCTHAIIFDIEHVHLHRSHICICTHTHKWEYIIVSFTGQKVQSSNG